MTNLAKFSAGCALAALAFSPVQAAELPRVGAPAVQADYAVQTVLNDGVDEAEHRSRYRYRRHRDRTDAGDIIVGAAIIGGVFAILAASNNSSKDRSERYDTNRYDTDYVSDDAFDNAVNSCVNRVEREQRIGSVDNVGRTRTGYSVSGTLASGTNFSCQVTGSGRVTSIDYGRSGVSYQSGGDVYGDPQYSDPQYSDDVYARARARVDSGPYSTPDSNAQPAYPGGPLPGDDGYGAGEYSEVGYAEEGYEDDGYGDDANAEEYGDGYSQAEPYR